MFVTDPRQYDNPVILANEAFLQLTGYQAEDVTGRNPRFLLGIETDTDAHARLSESLDVAREISLDLLHYRKDGSKLWVQVVVTPVCDDDNELEYFFIALIDIRQRRHEAERLLKVQGSLIHSSRVSAMAALASTLAHELNQPLAASSSFIRGSIKLLENGSAGQMNSALNGLAEACACNNRAYEIIRRMRVMVENGEPQRKIEDLTQMIKEACSLAMLDAPMLKISHRYTFDRAAATVLVDRIQIQQVMINLLRNAVDAVREAPIRTITVETDHKKDFCEVRVGDTGPGVAPVVQDQLFEPFNTSKGAGMGLGLSISRTIVEAHGGRIWASSGTSGGAVFHFTLQRP